MESKIQKITDKQIRVYNNDYVGAASYNIFAGVFVAFIFGAAFFFDLIWPQRKESRSVLIAWKVCGVLAVIFHLASALTLTIITAKHVSKIRGDYGRSALSHDEVQHWWRQYSKHSEAPLVYRHNPRAIPAVVFVWLGWISVLPSCLLLFLGIENKENGPGPTSRHAREQDASAISAEEGSMSDPEKKSVEDPTLPAPVHPAPSNVDGASVAPAAEQHGIPASQIPEANRR